MTRQDYLKTKELIETDLIDLAKDLIEVEKMGWDDYEFGTVFPNLFPIGSAAQQVYTRGVEKGKAARKLDFARHAR